MSDDWNVKVEGVSKKFGRSIKQAMRYGFMDSLRRMAGTETHAGDLREGEFWALEDVSFELKPCQALGIMGVNGSGKTTLLRVLNGTYGPDTGRAMLRGRVGALIAAGAGFSPVLTGRENIFVNGTLLGLSPVDIRRRFDDMVSFAGLEEFIDMPVRHYSSGMSVRLGFAVAAFCEPDVLLVDEVLAVGDLAFQKKCYDYLHTLKREGTTILLVSHSVGAIWALSDTAIFLDKGRLLAHGEPEEIIKAYDDQNAKQAAGNLTLDSPASAESFKDETYQSLSGGTNDARVHDVRVLDVDGKEPRTEFDMREGLCLEAVLEVYNPVEEPLLRYTLDAVHYRYISVLDSYEQGMDLARLMPGTYLWRTVVPTQNLRPGAYRLNLAVCSRRVGVHLFYHFAVASFVVKNPRDQFIYADFASVLHLDSRFELIPGKA